MSPDLCLLGGRKSPGASRVDRSTQPTSRSHQRNLGLQTAVGSLSIRHISRGIILLKDGGIVMLQDQVSLRFGDEAYAPVSNDRNGRSTCHPLLLSRASPLPRRKVYGLVGNSMPVIVPKSTICGRRVVYAKAFASEICAP